MGGSLPQLSVLIIKIFLSDTTEKVAPDEFIWTYLPHCVAQNKPPASPCLPEDASASSPSAWRWLFIVIY